MISMSIFLSIKDLDISIVFIEFNVIYFLRCTCEAALHVILSKTSKNDI